MYNKCKALFICGFAYIALWIMAFVPFIIYLFANAFTGFWAAFDTMQSEIWWSLNKFVVIVTIIAYFVSFITNIIGMILCGTYIHDMSKHTPTQHTEQKGKVGSTISIITYSVAGIAILTNIIMLFIK